MNLLKIQKSIWNKSDCLPIWMRGSYIGNWDQGDLLIHTAPNFRMCIDPWTPDVECGLCFFNEKDEMGRVWKFKFIMAVAGKNLSIL